MDHQNENNLLKWLKEPMKLPIVLVAVVAVAVVATFAVFQVNGNRTREAEITTVSTLQKIIDVSDLSTFTAVYNGIAEVMNEKNPEKTDYYVSYEARVEAGIDFSDIQISIDDRIIVVDIPDVKINDVIVDISSLDFIFYNNSANQSAVTQRAFRACEEDVQTETEKQDAILELAQQNAENIITALVQPIIDQLDEEYELSVK